MSVQERSAKSRMLAVAGLFAGLLVLIALRAVDLTLLRGPELSRLAVAQHRARIELTPHRGAIVDRHGEALALSVDVPSVYVRPHEVRRPDAAVALAGALHLPAKTVRAKLASPRPFVWMKRQATPREAEAVEGLAIPGVYTVAEGRRFYPHNALAAHVLGFVGVDSQGLEGIERRLDRIIRGQSHDIEADRDARGRAMFTAGVDVPPDEGSRVELTLDAGIQDATERELAAGVAAARAAGGAAVVLDPMTGEVLALANAPSFDPNQPGAMHDRRWRDRVRDRAITDPYEPGSTFKAILAAAAIEERVVRPTDMFFCENGRYQIGRWTVHDSHAHGWLNFAEVIQYSSNIGATKVGDRLGAERYYRYLRAFGFGARTGVELPGESPGIMRPVDTWARIDLATHSFGQGVSVTPMQMVAAFAAIANGGVMMRPYLVRRVVDPSGVVMLENRPTSLRRVVSPATAATVTTLLRRVVEEKGGTGERARMDDFPVAGKTGTAQKVNLHGRGYSTKRIGSFVGFVPADAPRVVILVLIDEPGTSSYGGVVAAPVFRDIATAVLQRLGVESRTPLLQMVSVPPPAPARKPPAVVGVAKPAAAPDAPATPSFLGLSRREALARARAAGWDVDVSGVGYVREQNPAP
ncbi:MAG TPA: penicillin-binding protein 2, partial [Candidatus Binatia bacterium]|nr:penicillin-binding protein 2 [Candidatus Binatia bacterium]